MTQPITITEFVARIPHPQSARLLDLSQKRVGTIGPYEPLVALGETREWRLRRPWPPLRVPADMGDIGGPTSEEALGRVFQRANGDALEVAFLPPGTFLTRFPPKALSSMPRSSARVVTCSPVARSS